MKTRGYLRVFAAAVLLGGVWDALADQWRCPVLSAASETTLTAGSRAVHNVGQIAVGVAVGGGVRLHAGVIPCYFLSQEAGGLVGDMNCDGVVSVGDIAGLVLAITNPAQYAIQFPGCNIAHADVNDDGAISVGDIGPFVALVTGG